MMSLYNEEKEKDEIKYISIIRELDIEIKNNKRYVFVRGEGKIIEIKSINTNNEKQYNIIENNELNENVNNNINEVDNKKYYIKNIIEINNSLILINTKDGKIMTLKKKNELDKIFKKVYNEFNKEKLEAIEDPQNIQNEEEIKRLSSIIKENKENINIYLSIIKENKENINRLNSQVENLKIKNENLQINLNSEYLNKEEINRLTLIIDENKEKMNKLNFQAEDLKRENNEYKSKISYLEQEVKNLSKSSECLNPFDQISNNNNNYLQQPNSYNNIMNQFNENNQSKNNLNNSVNYYSFSTNNFNYDLSNKNNISNNIINHSKIESKEKESFCQESEVKSEYSNIFGLPSANSTPLSYEEIKPKKTENKQKNMLEEK